MMKLTNNAMLLALIFMILIAVHLKVKLMDREGDPPEETLNASLQHKSLYEEDSLCQIWVYDTATRIAFKHWHNKQKSKIK